MKISVVKTETKLCFLTSILSLVLALSLSGCGDDDPPEPEAGADDGEKSGETAGETGGTGTGGTGQGTTTDGTGTAAASVPVGANVAEGFDLGVMHYVDQGSGFFPMSVIRALNDSETKAPFLEHMERFGLVPGEVSDRNPEGFPVGILTNTIKLG
jgi:hypothetical protein